MRGGWYDRKGQPIADLLTWARMLEDEGQRQVAYDRVDDVGVSTIWLGLDHGDRSTADHRPIIFETMVFGGERDRTCWRYATEEEAVTGHAYVLALVMLDALCHVDPE